MIPLHIYSILELAHFIYTASLYVKVVGILISIEKDQTFYNTEKNVLKLIRRKKPLNLLLLCKAKDSLNDFVWTFSVI